MYKTVEASLIVRLRGTDQQTDTGLLHLNGAISGRPGHPTRRVQGYNLVYSKLHNRSSATTVMGVGVRIPNWMWVAGQWTVVGTLFTDDTTAAQDTVAGDFPLETTTAADGFIIAADVPFNAISINVTTASVDAVSVARELNYSTAGAFTTTNLANQFIQDGLATNHALGENLYVFAAPPSWQKTTGAEAVGIPSGKYAIRVRATDAPTTAALAGSIEIFRLYGVQEGIVDNAVVEFAPGYPFSMPYGDALVALVGSISAVHSTAVVSFQPGGAMA